MNFSTGCDLASVAEVAQSLERFGNRYLDSILHPTERGEIDERCASRRDRSHYHRIVAGRFAMKEAVFKALNFPANIAGPWADVELAPAHAGGYDVLFHNEFKKWADGHPGWNVTVSVAYQEDLVMATAVAWNAT